MGARIRVDGVLRRDIRCNINKVFNYGYNAIPNPNSNFNPNPNRRPYWGSMFTLDERVRDMVYDAMPIMFFYLVVDAAKCVTLNILRSTGRPLITGQG
jgi:hypothetical protein